MLQSRAEKLVLIFLFLTIFSPGILLAASVTLDWKPNTEADLAGYRLYCGQQSREYTAVLETGMDTTFTVAGLAEGTTYYFALKAHDTWGNESNFSEEISHTVQESDDEDLSLITPDGGEQLVTGSEFDIMWEADTTIVKIRIWFSADAGRAWELVKGNTGNDGRWTWTVPAAFSDSCLLKLEEYQNPGTFDVSGDYFAVGDVTGVEDEAGDGLPKSLLLSQNYPNPFNPVTSISFSVPPGEGNYHPREVSMSVYDSRGRKVRELVAEKLPPGAHVVVWDGKTERGEIAPSGIYFYALRVGSEVSPARKMLLAR
jgi:hypothetical protein